jgi:PTS system trehalose-specific IIC component
MVFSGLAGMFVSIRGVLANSIGVGGLPGIFSIQTSDWGSFFIAMLVVFTGPLVLTYLYARREFAKQDEQEERADEEAALADAVA